MSASVRWASGGATDQGRVRNVNQDAFLDRPDLGIWVVADGMGGHTDGAIASHALTDALGRLAQLKLLGVAADAAARAIETVNRQLIERAQQTGGGDLIGSTVVALLALNGYCALLWVGDSRIYRLRGGTLEQLTRDHSQVQALVESGALSPEMAEMHPLSNVLLRAVGSEDQIEIDRRIERLAVGDRYLLCSDGLFREVGPETIASTLASLPPAEAAKTLIQLACDHGGRDNVTAVVVEIAA